jgi:LemA protein
MEYDAPIEIGYGAPAIQPRRARRGPWIAFAALLLLPPLTYLGLHNGLVSRLEAVDAAWAQVESAHQRRADLVPVLVETVKRHMRHEAETLVAVVEARSAAARPVGAQAGHAPADPAELARVARAQTELALGLQRLVALAESHPELRSADSFLELQAQLEGAENRIHVARVAFNDSVRAYNAAIQKLPGAWIAQARGMERRGYFESDEGAERARPLGLD